jgi:xanthine dehydrogenase D subunit
MSVTGTPTVTERGVGAARAHREGVPKVSGEFEFASDLHRSDALFGATLRSPHASARIRSIDVTPALSIPGVRCALTHRDVPGRPTYGLEVPDQPVLAADRVRYHGEPVAIVAADTPVLARRAVRAIAVDYEPLEALTDPEAAIAPGAPPLHPDGNVLRRVWVRHGPDAGLERTDDLVVVEGTYEVGMQDQAFLGPEAGLAEPTPDGGVSLDVATQWLHVDRAQMALSLGLPEEKVHLRLAGVGGAFGGREDLSVQIHAAMLALRTGRPVKMAYAREESFLGHVHRHPARLHYVHAADRDGRLRWVRVRVVFDGGAYASSSRAVCLNAASTAIGPYRCPAARIEAIIAYTNNPPCGAMRGFGAVQTCFAYEAQMDRLAEALELGPIELRLRNAAEADDELPTGQRFGTPAPAAELLKRLADHPVPDLPIGSTFSGEAAAASEPSDLRRGIGWAIGFKNVGFSDGFDENSTARVRLEAAPDGLAVTVHTAACEVGQGLVTVQDQIARTELPAAAVHIHTADTAVGNAGSSSASRQSWMTGGAVRDACRAARAELVRSACELAGCEEDDVTLEEGGARTPAGLLPWDEVIGPEAIEATRVFRPRATEPLDENGQGDAHFAFAYAAHRAIVDVDPELGIVRLVEMATTQDVGRAVNPLAVEGQVAGGIVQGIGLALMEELVVQDGRVLNGSFTDYLLPTALDVPRIRLEALELEHPDSPYGLIGVGEAPTIASTAAIAAAVRDATGAEVTRVPIRPEHLAARTAPPRARGPRRARPSPGR